MDTSMGTGMTTCFVHILYVTLCRTQTHFQLFHHLPGENKMAAGSGSGYETNVYSLKIQHSIILTSIVLCEKYL